MARRELCPGSAAAEAAFPEKEEESEYSKEGTLLHAIDAEPELANQHKLTAEQLDVLKVAQRVDEQIFAAVAQNLRLAPNEPFEEGRETELWLYRGLKQLIPGHCDRWRFYPRPSVLVVIDKKFGRNVVTPADANIQLRNYAVMGYKKKKAKHVLVAINQPRLPMEERLSIAEYTEEQIPAAQKHLLAIWDGAHNPDGTPRTDVPRIAGEEQCRYCSARLVCDARRAKFDWLSIAAEAEKEQFTGALSNLTNTQLDKVHQAVAFAGLIKDDVKAEIARRVEAGSMTNYEMKRTGNTSKITDTAKAIALLEGIGCKREDLIAMASLPLGKIAEDIYFREGITQIAAKKKVAEALNPVLEVTPKEPSLKRIGNPIDALPAAPAPEALP